MLWLVFVALIIFVQASFFHYQLISIDLDHTTRLKQSNKKSLVSHHVDSLWKFNVIPFFLVSFSSYFWNPFFPFAYEVIAFLGCILFIRNILWFKTSIESILGNI